AGALTGSGDAARPGRSVGGGTRRAGRAARGFAPAARSARAPRCPRPQRAVRAAAGRPMIRIYHTSDLHDRRHVAAPLKRLRAERPGLLVDCGDSLRGSQTVYFRREPIIDVLDEADYD